MTFPRHPKRLYQTSQWLTRTRKQALHRADYRCAHCQADLANAGWRAHVHHIIPTSHAPALIHDPLNLEVLCHDCHNREHDRGTWGCTIDGQPLDPKHPWNSMA